MVISIEFVVAFLMMLGAYLIGHRFGEHRGIQITIDKFVEAKLIEEVLEEELDE